MDYGHDLIFSQVSWETSSIKLALLQLAVGMFLAGVSFFCWLCPHGTLESRHSPFPLSMLSPLLAAAWPRLVLKEMWMLCGSCSLKAGVWTSTRKKGKAFFVWPAQQDIMSLHRLVSWLFVLCVCWTKRNVKSIYYHFVHPEGGVKVVRNGSSLVVESHTCTECC